MLEEARLEVDAYLPTGTNRGKDVYCELKMFEHEQNMEGNMAHLRSVCG